MPVPSVSVVDGSGKVVGLEEVRRDVTVVVFWATWCAPCLEELPVVQGVARRFERSSDVRVMVVNVDDPVEQAREVMEKVAPELEVWSGGQAALEAMAPVDERGVVRVGLPLTVVIDRMGRVHRRLGFEQGSEVEEEIVGMIERARRGEPPPALLVEPDPESPMKIALPRMSRDERSKHMPVLRAQLAEMFPAFSKPALDRVIAKADEVAEKGGTLVITVPAIIPIAGGRGGTPGPFY